MALYIVCTECGNWYRVNETGHAPSPDAQKRAHELLGCPECQYFECELIDGEELSRRLKEGSLDKSIMEERT